MTIKEIILLILAIYILAILVFILAGAAAMTIIKILEFLEDWIL